MQRLLVQLSAAKLRRSPLTVSRLRRDWQLCVKAFATRDVVADVRSVTIDAEDGKRIPLRIYEGAGLGRAQAHHRVVPRGRLRDG